MLQQAGSAAWPNMDTDPGSDSRQNNSISPPKKCEIGEIQG